MTIFQNWINWKECV